MARTQVLIIYTRNDRTWFERLNTHLVLLGRIGLVHAWSDAHTAFQGGVDDDSEAILRNAGAIVLLISPDFLASDPIWNSQMPRILEQAAQGAVVLPLITRPCAWGLAPALAQLQPRPSDGRALSLATHAESDRDLAKLVYEVAARVTQGTTDVLPIERSDVVMREGETWTGIYEPTGRRLSITITKRIGRHFSGRIEYVNDDSVTAIEGYLLDPSRFFDDDSLGNARARMPVPLSGVTFRETHYMTKGSSPPELGGAYKALVSRDAMIGVWHSNEEFIGPFELEWEG